MKEHLGKGVHVVTVNEYLTERDATEMGELYSWLSIYLSDIVIQIYICVGISVFLYQTGRVQAIRSHGHLQV